ncbi:TetR/AcrR family transcriptional regulator [Nocardioides litoris]|uniref:TetR/AcrR family transcriptional regulator n=1 Tax=Nocardioides litoris TaxID=1926648 RepID=UPI001122CF19|nr:TetR/AcrR family transcriptional regulator [Nocardioides litoris]
MVNSGTHPETRATGKAVRTRQALVAATLEVVAETGEFTGEQVAARTGVSTATFYAHFETKDHAVHACLQRAFEDYRLRMQEVESIERLLDVGLRETMTAIVRTITAINDEYRSLLRLARARVRASPLLREQSRVEERRAFAASLRLVVLGQAAGMIRRADPEVLTATVRTLVEGLDAWTVRSHPAVAETEIPELLTTYLSPTPTLYPTPITTEHP